MKHVLLVLTFLYALTGWSHSGGTDSNGCHTNHQTGDYHCHNPKRQITSEQSADSENYQVMFNTKSKKIHRPACKSAKACTVNCILLKKSEAVSRGGVPCGNCGG